MTATPDALRVVQLTAENYKRLTAVEITPNPDSSTVVIGGRNAQGKSSVLDAIWSAIRGTDAAKATGTTRPIRDGADTARVRVDLGDLIVTRTWKDDKSTLVVTSGDGARYSSPQKMLDDLVGAVSFDPLAFTRASHRQQAADLAALAGLGSVIAETAAKRTTLYEERTVVGRALKQAESTLSATVEKIDGRDLPDEPVDVAALVEEARAARAAVDARDAHAGRISSLEARREALRAELAEVESRLEDEATQWGTGPLAPSEEDIERIEARIADSQETDRLYRLGLDLAQAQEWVDLRQGERDDLTAAIEALDDGLRAKIAAAEFPVPGLGFALDGAITLEGVPFSQASAAEQLRVSVAMAMAANPRLRVIRIADGSLLDDDSMRMVEEMSTAGGFQVWIERVGDPGEVGVVIEDGQVAGR